MNFMVFSSVNVWCVTASESSTGRMVRLTMVCPILNSPSVPRSEITRIAGICEGTISDASTFGITPKPEVCIITQPRRPAIQAPATMPTASSSRVAQTEHEIIVGLGAAQQRGEHIVGHIGHQPDIVVLQRGEEVFRPMHFGDLRAALFMVTDGGQ